MTLVLLYLSLGVKGENCMLLYLILVIGVAVATIGTFSSSLKHFFMDYLV